MSPAGVAAANERLATPMAIDVAASERMGLVVVGHLAARHRITVELRGSPDGVTAQAWLPGQLLFEALWRYRLQSTSAADFACQLIFGLFQFDFHPETVAQGFERGTVVS